MNALTKIYRTARAEMAWRRYKPALLQMVKSQVLSSFSTVTVSDVYARNGYDGIAALLGGGQSDAGISVHAENSLEIAALYACTKILGEDMGSLPFFLHERSEDGRSTEKARGHRLFSILHDLVNPDTSAGEFVEALTSHAFIAQNGFAGIERSGTGRDIIWLRQWMPSEVRLDKDSKGNLVYIRKEGNLTEKTHGRGSVFHLKGFTFNGLSGDSMIHRARQAIGLSLAAQQYASAFFKNDAHLGVILERPMDAPELAPDGVKKLKEDFIKWQVGLDKAHGPFIAQEGMKVSRQLADHEKAQLIEQRKFQLEEVARLARMPLHRLGHLDRMTFNNVEQLGIDYVSYTLGPWVRRWREAVYRCLLTRGEQLENRLYAEHAVEALQRGDFKSQAIGFAMFLERGAYTVNEVRRWQNLNPVEGGDTPHIQMNMQSLVSAAAALADGDNEAASKYLLAYSEEFKVLAGGQNGTGN